MSTSCAIHPDISEMIDDSPDGSIFRLHRAAMTSEKIWELEKKKIFDRCWLYLAHESEIAEDGAFITRTLNGRPLILARQPDGTFKVFLNSCTHRGAQVCRERSGVTKTFRCFYHNWTFRTTGELAVVPYGESYFGEFDKSKLGLKEIRSESYRGFVFVNFNAQSETLVEYLAGAAKYIDYVADQGPDGMVVTPGTQLYSMRANWKLLVENTVDFYHTVPTHTSYFDFLKTMGGDTSSGVRGRGVDLGNGHCVVEFKAPWGKPVARWEPSWGEADRIRLEKLRADLVELYGEERTKMIADTDRNLVIFPNLLINDALSPVIRTSDPLSPNMTHITQWSIGPANEPPHVTERRLTAFNTFLGPGGFATPDDIEALEGCQRGFEWHDQLPWSDYSRGYARELDPSLGERQSDDEVQLRAYYRRWQELLMSED